MEAPPGYGRLRSESSILALDPQRQAERDPRHGIRRHLSRLMRRMLPDVHFALTSYGGVVRAQASLPFPCHANDLLPLVLRSPPVTAAMQGEEAALRDKGGAKGGAPVRVDGVQKRARKAFGRLAADMRLWAVRWMGWILSQVWRMLYNNEIFVDLESLKRVKALPPDMPVVYLPTHKSHMDYLLLSYVLFAYDMPVPHIAAGENLAIPLVGYLLRKSGAFFIRRSARGSPDQAVYKAILNQYVMQLLASRRPLEFFIEGGRSRDGKVCPPKLGLLSVVVRALLTGQVDEVAVVPMAIAYDVVLEERSFVLEMTGVPKQPETLAQLVRGALHALRTRHGRVYVTMARPFSLRAFLQQAIGCQLSRPLSASPSPACLQPPPSVSWAMEGRERGGGDAVSAEVCVNADASSSSYGSRLPAALAGVGKEAAEPGCLCRERGQTVAAASTSPLANHAVPAGRCGTSGCTLEAGAEEDVALWMSRSAFPQTGECQHALATAVGHPALGNIRGVPCVNGPCHALGSGGSQTLASGPGMPRGPFGATALSPQEEWQLSILSGEAVVSGMRSSLIATPTSLLCTAFLAGRAVLAPSRPSGGGVVARVAAEGERDELAGGDVQSKDAAASHAPAQGLSVAQLTTIVRWLSDQVATRGALVAHGGYPQVADDRSKVGGGPCDERRPGGDCGHCCAPAIRHRRHLEATKEDGVAALAVPPSANTQRGGGEPDGIMTCVRWALRLLEASGAVASTRAQPIAAAATSIQELRGLDRVGPSPVHLALSVADEDLESGERTALLAAASSPAGSEPWGSSRHTQINARMHAGTCGGSVEGRGAPDGGWVAHILGRIAGMLGRGGGASGRDQRAQGSCSCSVGACRLEGGCAPADLVYDAPSQAEARLLMYYHMNQIMHLFAAEALLASALSGQLGSKTGHPRGFWADLWGCGQDEGQDGGEEHCHVADASGSEDASWQRGSARETADVSTSPVASHEGIMADAHWLHQLLRSELVPLLGEARELPWRRCMAGALQRLVQSGEVTWSECDGRVHLTHAPCPGQDATATGCNNKTDAWTHAHNPRVRPRYPLLHFLLASITPLLNTYLVIIMNLHVLYHCDALEEKELLSGAMEALEELSTAGQGGESDDSEPPRPCFIPSTLVVQGAITSLVEMGVLLRRDADDRDSATDNGTRVATAATATTAEAAPLVAGDAAPATAGTILSRSCAKRDVTHGEHAVGSPGEAAIVSISRAAEDHRGAHGTHGGARQDASETPCSHGNNAGASEIILSHVADASRASAAGGGVPIPSAPRGLPRSARRGSGGSGSGGGISPSLPRSLPSMRDFSFMPSIASVSNLPDLVARTKSTDRAAGVAGGGSYVGAGLRGGGQAFGRGDKGGSFRKRAAGSTGGSIKVVLLSPEYAADYGKLAFLERRIRSFMQPFPE
eukprot:jgi/Mesvir1/27109/Mv20790-RA.1